MRKPRFVQRYLQTPIVLSLLAAALPCVAAAQSLVAPRILQPVDNSSRVTLKGTVSPLANAKNDAGPASADMRVEHLQLAFKRSPAQESSLQQLISAMHTPGSPSFHKWLTPTEFGQQFGPADQDIEAIKDWVRAEGFEVGAVNPGKGTLEISGTVGQLQTAFHTSIHKYTLNGQPHYANSTAAQIPTALAPVLNGFVSLNNFPVHRMSRYMGKATYDPANGHATPQWTNPDQNSPFLYDLVLAPQDFGVEYDLPNTALNSNFSGTTLDGTGQSIAIVNDSNINLAFVNNFRSLFNLPANPPQVIIDGNDPGIDGINNPDGPNGDSVEAYLDVEWAGAVAPKATVNLVIGADTALSSGLILAAERAIYTNIAPVLSLSFGSCEQELGQSNAFLNDLWEQAAAQGITVLVATGDNGSAGTGGTAQDPVCDNPDEAQVVDGLAVSGFASTPFDVAVGGTDFYYSTYGQAPSTIETQLGTYWNLTPSTTPTASILGYVPEQPWNDSPLGLNILVEASPDTAGGGGGPSTCVNGDLAGDGSGVYFECTGGYPKPAWQQGVGVPSTNARYIPDVSLFASSGVNNSFYPICAADGDCQPDESPVQISGIGGTSASTPSMAGILALVNQKYGPQGQADYVLYPLAKQFPTAFHDVVHGSNAEPCEIGSANCGPQGALTGYAATVGYDPASGLGSVDANLLINNWNSISFTGTTTTLTPSTTSFTHGTAVTINTNVSASGGTPTGDVSLVTSSPTLNNQGQTFFTLSNGSASGSVNSLPGGSYEIWGQYGGDGTYGASSSSKTQVTVTPESSSIIFNVITPNSNSSGYSAISTGTTGIPYGTQLTLDSQLVPTSFYNSCNGGNSTSQTCMNTTFAGATGTVTYADNGNPLNVAVINTQGDAEYTGSYAIGNHSVKASYSGDASYNASSSTAVTFSIVQVPQSDISVFVTSNLGGSNQPSIPAGQTLVLNAIVEGVGTGAAPTGTVKFSNGATLYSPVTLAAGVDPSTGNSIGIATFSLPVTASAGYTAVYSGDANYAAASSALYPVTVIAATGLTSSVSGTASPSVTSPTSAITVAATVTGQSGHPAPTGVIEFVSSGTPLGTVPLTAGSGATSSVQFNLNSSILLQGSNQITLQYQGDGVYQPSSSLLTINNPLSDFSMVAQVPIITVASGGSTTETINLAAVNGFNSAINLTCAAPAAITCTLNPTSVTVGGATSTTVTIAAESPSSALRPQNRMGWFMASGGATLACVVMLGLPGRRKKWQSLLGLVVIAILTAGIGCGGGSGSGSSSGSGSGSNGGGGGNSGNNGNAAVGSYDVVITGSAGTAISHNVAIKVEVQAPTS